MNIIDAIKTGRKYRRPNALGGYNDWRAPYSNYNTHMEFAEEGILSDDWEVEEAKVEVTREKVELAWKHVMCKYIGDHNYSDTCKEFCKELGLK